MKVLLAPRQAVPAFRHLAPATKREIKHALRLLAEDPSGLTNNLDVKRLDVDVGQPIYRLRVGDWRLAFTVESDIVVFRIFHRRDGYRWLFNL